MDCVTGKVADHFPRASFLPVEIIRHILLSLDPRDLIRLQTVRFHFSDQTFFLPALRVSRFLSSSMLSSVTQSFGGLCTLTPACLDHPDHFPGSRPSSSNEPLFTPHDYNRVGLHNPSK